MAISHRIKLDQSRVSGRKIIWLAMVAILLFLAYVLFQKYHIDQQNFDTVTVYTPKTVVKKNRYFAAKEMLGERAYILRGNQDSQKVEELLDEDAEFAQNHALMIYNFSSQKSSDHEKILAWVSRGGHLITASQVTLYDDLDSYQERQNPLLLTLGITYKFLDNNYSATQLDKNTSISKQITPLRLADGQTLLVEADWGIFDTSELLQKYPDVKLYNYAWFYQNANDMTLNYISPIDTGMSESESQKIWTVANKGHNFSPDRALVDMSFGQGRITVLANQNMFVNPNLYQNINQDDQLESPETSNTSKVMPSRTWQILTEATDSKMHDYQGGIVNADHAYFLKILTGMRDVYFLPDIQSVSLLTLLWENMRLTMVGLILTIILALLALPKRFGRLKTYQTDISQNIFGFFGHVGQYLWVSDGAHGILQTNRESFIRTVIAKEQLVDGTPAKIIEILNVKTALSTHLIQNALYDSWQNDEEFLYISRNFARLTQFYN